MKRKSNFAYNSEAVKFRPKEWVVLWNVGNVAYRTPWQLGDVVYDGAQQETTIADLDAIVAAFNKEGKPLFCDEEHFHRLVEGSSKALAWFTELKREGNLLYGRASWTEAGLKLVETGELRYISPTLKIEPLDANEAAQSVPRVRPVSLQNAGLTNTPRNKSLPPISEPVADAPIFTNREETSAAPEAQTKPNNKTMNPKLIALLGLGPDASEDDVMKAVEALLAKEQKANADAAATVMNSYKDVIPQGKEEAYRNGLLTNRDFTMQVLADLRELKKPAAATTEATATTPAQVFNRETATTPALAKSGDAKEEKDRTPAEHAAFFNSMKAGKERSAYHKRNRDAIFEGQI